MNRVSRFICLIFWSTVSLPPLYSNDNITTEEFPLPQASLMNRAGYIALGLTEIAVAINLSDHILTNSVPFFRFKNNTPIHSDLSFLNSMVTTSGLLLLGFKHLIEGIDPDFKWDNKTNNSLQ